MRHYSRLIQTKNMRTKNSCRFEPYYKAELFDARLCVWRPIQKSFKRESDARNSMPAGAKARVIKITEKGIEVI